ncbi:hypothetical protein CL657_03180 [bacterium]|nr:hypothetical protein [bacterium]
MSNCSNFATQQPQDIPLPTQLLKNTNQPTSCSLQQRPRSYDTPWVDASNSEDLIFPLSLEDEPASGSDSLPSSPLSSSRSSSSDNLNIPCYFSCESKSSPGIGPGPKLRPLPQTSQPY